MASVVCSFDNLKGQFGLFEWMLYDVLIESQYITLHQRHIAYIVEEAGPQTYFKLVAEEETTVTTESL